MPDHFIVAIALRLPGEKEPGAGAVFVTEHTPDVDALAALASSLMIDAEIEVDDSAVTLPGDGASEIAWWMRHQAREIDPPPAVTPDPYSARMNAMEREISSTSKHVRRIEQLIEQLARAVTRGGTPAYDAPSDPAPAQPSASEMLAALDRARVAPASDDAGYDPRVRDVAHDERAGAPLSAIQQTNIVGTTHGGSMALVGMPATSQIFSSSNGVDEKGLPKASRPPRVRDTLRNGNLLRDDD